MKKTKKKPERRKGKERRKSGAMNVIFSRLVARKILPERRKGDRREP